MSDSIDNSSQSPGGRDAGERLPSGAELPGELRGVARALDQRGRRLRAQSALAPEALERIFAASDLQLPLNAGPSSDRASVVARIGASPSRGAWSVALRIAAAVAVAAGVGLVAFVAVRGFRGDAAPPVVTPEGTLARGEPAVAPDAALADAALAGAGLEARVTARDLEAALSGALATRTSARPSATVVLAVDDRFTRGRGDATAHIADLDAYEALAAAGFDGEPVTFDELSGEFSALLALSGAPR
jgi:hypothetical protein